MFHFKLQKEQKVRLLTDKPPPPPSPSSRATASDIFVARGGGGGPERAQQQQQKNSNHIHRNYYQQQQQHDHHYQNQQQYYERDNEHNSSNNNEEVEGASLFFPLWRKRSYEQRLEQSRARAQELSVLYEVNSPLSSAVGAGAGGVDSRPLIKASSFDSACSGSSSAGGLPKLSTVYMTPQQAMEAYAKREAEALQNQLMDPLLNERERKQLLEKQQEMLKPTAGPPTPTTTSAISSSATQPATARRTMYQAAQQQRPLATIKGEMVGIEIVPTRSFSSSSVATTPTPASSSGRSSYEFIENVPHLC